MTLQAVLFHGTDLAGSAPELLRRAAAEGQALVALDSLALAWATRQGLPHAGLEGWLGREALTRARLLAPKFEAAWFAPRRADFTVDGLCWPEHDREALYCYWLSACVALELCQALARGGVTGLTVFRRDPPRPMLYYDPADTAATYWAGAFPGPVRTVLLPEPAAEPETDPAATRPAPFLHDNTELLRNRVAICLNPLEVFRLRRHIAELAGAFSGRAVLVLNSHLACHTDAATQDTGLPALGLGPAGKPGDDVPGCFQRGFAGLLEQQAEPLRGILRHNAGHFEALFRRWAWQEATRGYWRRAMLTASPGLVAVSSLEDSESQLPALAAAQAGVPSLCLPHGIGMTRVTRPKSSLVLYQGAADREAYLRSGIPAQRLTGCHDLGIENEYPVDEAKAWNPGQDRLKVLALMAATGRPGVLYPAIGQQAQLDALRSLAEPPPDLAPRLALSLKTHPGLPDLEIIEVAGPGVQALLLPLDLPLAQALEAADLVVALNYSGVGVLHCAQAGKPLLQFWLDPDIGRADPMLFADLYAPAGDLVRTPQAFWDAVRRFLDEPAYAGGLRQRARDFDLAFRCDCGPGERRSLRDIALAVAARQQPGQPGHSGAGGEG